MSVTQLILTNDEIEQIEKALGYVFTEKRLLCKAFTHSSFVNENKGAVSNERLEFFGDRILNFLVSKELFYNEAGDEGRLTVLLKERVSRYPLAQSVNALNIIGFLRTAGSSSVIDFEHKAVSNLYEAIIGAIYVDSGSLDACAEFIGRTLKTDLEPDYISLLKEYQEKNKLSFDKSEEKTREGFVCKITVRAKVFSGRGRKKKDAERDCAKAVCGFLKLT